MNQDHMHFIVHRDVADRRSSDNRFEPPYLTEEGMVLIDRRAKNDRRAASRPTVTNNIGTIGDVANR